MTIMRNICVFTLKPFTEKLQDYRISTIDIMTSAYNNSLSCEVNHFATIGNVADVGRVDMFTFASARLRMPYLSLVLSW